MKFISLHPRSKEYFAFEDKINVTVIHKVHGDNLKVVRSALNGAVNTRIESWLYRNA
jgi:hypothetical protein